YSVHTVPAELLPVVAAATKSLVRKLNSYRARAGTHYDGFAKALDETLAAGPMPAVQIRRRIDPEHELGELFSVLMGMAASQFQVVRTITTGTWRSDRFLYARWSDWLPECDPDSLDHLDAKRDLVQRYVAAYGPVDLADVKWWTGWTKAEAVEAVDGIDLGKEGAGLVGLDGVRLLPVWDVLMVAYRNRDRLFDPSYSPLTHDRFGNATSVVLENGRVVGQWDLGSADDPLRIKVAPFFEWSEQLWQDVEVQAHRIARLIGAESVTVVPIDEPVDLLDSSRNRFLAPLSKK
ncbi:MAG: crosslink repair DNA glycosylase YcaQ family protein, partial [Acidimicrobiia bacterium]|nr:crosslink repair DNA glycosylase YcaQ family protein [Acidimicrobiia bacterium]